MSYSLVSTDTFSKILKKHKNNNVLLEEPDKKLNKLKINPEEVGGMLSGKLHGYKSTRLAKKFRLIFKIEENKVFLIALDHRGRVYD